MTVRLRFRGQERLLVGLGIATEAGVPMSAMGGNEAVVPSLEGFDDEQLAELGRLVRDPLPEVGAGPAPGGSASDTEGPVPSVGDAPPRTGPGASRAAWVAYADDLRAAGVALPAISDDQNRDEIIALVEAHHHAR